LFLSSLNTVAALVMTSGGKGDCCLFEPTALEDMAIPWRQIHVKPGTLNLIACTVVDDIR
jgi:hypothetical protein